MAFEDSHGVEEVGYADGYHQTLLVLPSHRRQSSADGAVWGETLDRYGSVLKLHPTRMLLGADRRTVQVPSFALPNFCPKNFLYGWRIACKN